MYWTTAVALGVILLIVAVLLLFRRRILAARRDLLRALAQEFGCTFHGDSFRGRFRARALRGDAVDEMPRRTGVRPGFMAEGLVASVLFGALAALRAITSGARRARTVLRLRVELCARGVPEPDGAAAAAAVRRNAKVAFPDAALHEVSTVGGTEIVIILRDAAATAQTARRYVEMAIDASAPQG